MDRTVELIVSVISGPPEKRTDDAVETTIAWLRKMSAFLRDVDPVVLKQLIKRCQHRVCQPDEVLLRQGDRGDCMYVVVSGKVGVYIDGTISGEDRETGWADDVSDAPWQNMRNSVRMSTPTSTSAASDINVAGRPAAVMKKLDDVMAVLAAADRIKTKAFRKQRSNNDATEVTADSTESRLVQSPLHEGGIDVAVNEIEKSNDTTEIDGQERQQELDRTLFGKYVVSFGPGKCVGELALLNNDSLRNATIVCDELTHFIVISRALYVDTIKQSQEMEFSDRRRFVNSHSLFRGWNSSLRRLLEMSLIREAFEFDQPIVKQGQAFDGLVFIQSGQAKVVVEPEKHKVQFSSLMAHPGPPVAVTKRKASFSQTKPHSQVTSAPTLRRRRPVATETTTGSSTSASNPTASRLAMTSSTMRGDVTVRRQQGYAAAESRLRRRKVEMCTVEAGEIVGDIELIFCMNEYLESVVCTQPVTAYVLTAKNLERLLSKRNTHTVDLLRTAVESKLARRVKVPSADSESGDSRRLVGVPTSPSKAPTPASNNNGRRSSIAALLDDNLPVPLLGRLLYRLRRPPELPAEEPPALTSSKTLPNEDVLFQHFLRSYVDGRTHCLAEPCVPGAIFYRNLMTDRANRRRIREAARPETKMTPAEANRQRRSRQRNIIENRKPRTAVEIKRLVQRPERDYEQLNEAETVRQLIMVEDSETRQLCEQLRQNYCLERPLLAGDALTSLHQTILEQLDRIESRSQRERVRSSQLTDGCNQPDDVIAPKLAEDTIQEPDVLEVLPLPGDQMQSSDGKKSAEIQSAKPDAEDKGEDAFPIAAKTSLAPVQLQVERTKTFLTEVSDIQSDPGGGVGGKEETEAIRPVKSAFTSLATRETAPSDVGMTSPAPTDGNKITSTRPVAVPALALDVNGEGRRKSTVDNVLKDFEDISRQKRILRTRMSLTAFRRGQRVDRMLDNPTYRDWETSNRSLTYLEHRVADFLRQTGGATSLSDVTATARMEETFETFNGLAIARKPVTNLPKLMRYETAVDAAKYPVPGGRVVVRRRDCDQQQTDRSLLDHDHLNVNVVPELNDYERLRRSKMVMYHLLDDVRHRVAVQT